MGKIITCRVQRDCAFLPHYQRGYNGCRCAWDCTQRQCLRLFNHACADPRIHPRVYRNRTGAVVPVGDSDCGINDCLSCTLWEGIANTVLRCLPTVDIYIVVRGSGIIIVACAGLRRFPQDSHLRRVICNTLTDLRER